MEAPEAPETLDEPASLPTAAAEPPDDPTGKPSSKRRRRPADSRVPVSDTAAESSRRRGRTRASVTVAPEPDQEAEAGKVSFRVGDLVWGKLASNTWWPGKVLYPSKDVPAAKKHGEGHPALVAYFGYGSGTLYDSSQLKPFNEEFKHMVKQSSSKRLAAAVAEALVEVKKVLESETACYCLWGTDRSPKREFLSASKAGDEVADRSLSKYVLRAAEFLELLLVAARDVSSVDMLEVTMLRCLAVAFHRRNERPIDLVDNDAPNSKDDKLEEELEIAGVEGRLLKRANVLDESKQRRKERSILELIADKDSEVRDQDGEEEDVVFLDQLGPSALKSRKRKKGDNGEISGVQNGIHVALEEKATELENLDGSPAALLKQKKNVKSKGSDTHNGDAEVFEQSGYSRRERRKSKYLSPPYTSVSGYSKFIVSSKDVPVEISEKYDASKVSLNGTAPNPEGNQDVYQNQEENETTPIFRYNQVSVAEILSKFLSAAADPLYLKWSRSAKMVRNFIDTFRGSMYSDGPNFLNYKNLLDGLGSECGISKGKDLGDGPGKSKDIKKRNKGKDGISDETSVNPGHHLTVPNGSTEISKKRKISRDNDGTETLPKLDHNSTNDSKKILSGRRREMKKSVDGKRTKVDTFLGLSNGTEKDSSRINKGEDAANGVTQDGLANSESSKLLKKRKSKNESNGKTILNLDQKHSTGSEGKNKESQTMVESPVSLVLTYERGTSLPSKEEIISIHSAYGSLVESDIEVLENSHSVRVVFKRLSNAKKAVKWLYAGESLPPSIAKYELHKPENIRSKSQETPPSRTPLPYIRKNLEKMISKLSDFTPTEKDERISNRLKPEVRDTLVGEMDSLLKKVDKLLTGPSAGNLI